MKHSFEYDLAFSRNIGWLTEDEQQILKTKRMKKVISAFIFTLLFSYLFTYFDFM